MCEKYEFKALFSGEGLYFFLNEEKDIRSFVGLSSFTFAFSISFISFSFFPTILRVCFLFMVFNIYYIIF